MFGVFGSDDLLARAFVEFADAVELQVQRIAQHAGGHLAQRGAATGRGKQQRLLAFGALADQTLHVLGKAHVEHAVGFVEDQHLDILEDQRAGIQVLDHAPRRADENVRHLAHDCGLDLEVLATGNHRRLDEGELRETLDLLQRLLRQLSGRQQNQRPNIGAHHGIANQPIEHRQYEGGGLAAASLCRHPQVTPFQRRRNGRHLHWSRLDEFEFGDSL